MRAFEHGEVLEAGARVSLIQQLALDPSAELVFAIDRSTAGEALEAFVEALAVHRAKIARAALISCDAESPARIEVPPGADAGALIRAARGLTRAQTAKYSSVWSCLEKVATLRLSSRAQVYLLADDRSPPKLISMVRSSSVAPAGARDRVSAWARGSKATLHAVRCAFEPLVELSAPPDPGMPIELAAAFFEKARIAASREGIADQDVGATIALGADRRPKDLFGELARAAKLPARGKTILVLGSSPVQRNFAAHREALEELEKNEAAIVFVTGADRAR